jgi:HlyD family secretion protein
MKKTTAALLALLLTTGAALGVYALWLRRAPGAGSYRFTTVLRGDLDQVVAATGILEAEATVRVGTQVSGIIAEILADYNDPVRRGQVVARLDSSLLEIAVRDARAALDRATAELDKNRRDLERLRSLSAQGLVAETDLNTLQTSFAVARANREAAAAALDRAERNLAYATIYAPIDGVIVDRFVDVGQTVAASLSAPELFRIADLTRMQILVAVDESDIRQVHDGQEARFTVQAYPDEAFRGRVRQVRLQSTTQENVVSYTVVVAVDNPERRLLPGMTATVEFLVDSARDVLRVANAALRFRPPAEMIAALRERRRAEGGSGGFGRSGGAGGGLGNGRGDGRSSGGGDGRPTVLWTVDAHGQPHPVPVQVGISDGQSTAVSGPGLEEGMQVITGVTENGQTAPTNPFQPAGGGQGGGRRSSGVGF